MVGLVGTTRSPRSAAHAASSLTSAWIHVKIVAALLAELAHTVTHKAAFRLCVLHVDLARPNKNMIGIHAKWVVASVTGVRATRGQRQMTYLSSAPFPVRTDLAAG